MSSPRPGGPAPQPDRAPRAWLPWLGEAFCLAGELGAVPVARGAMGRVWRVDTATGPHAAKELFWEPPTGAQAARELAFAAAARAVGVPSPAGLPGADGSPLQVEPGTGRTWRLYEWVDGDVPPRDDLPTAQWLAGCVARMHLLAEPPGGDVDPWFWRVDADWPALADAADRAGKPWAARLRRRLPHLAELTARVAAAPPEETVYTHADANAANTLVERGTGRRVLVDWDNCGPLPPVGEVGRLVQDHYRDDDAVRRVVRAYRAAGGPADLDGPHVLSVAQAIWLNYVSLQVDTLLNPAVADPDQRAFAERGLGLLEQLPTPAELDHVLDVVRRA